MEGGAEGESLRAQLLARPVPRVEVSLAEPMRLLPVTPVVGVPEVSARAPEIRVPLMTLEPLKPTASVSKGVGVPRPSSPPRLPLGAPKSLHPIRGVSARPASPPPLSTPRIIVRSLERRVVRAVRARKELYGITEELVTL